MSASIERLRTAYRSIAGKLLILLAIFVAVPAILYSEFQSAQKEERSLLLHAVREQGRLVAEGLHPYLQNFDGGNVSALNDALARFGSGSFRVRLLLRVNDGAQVGDFFYIGAHPKLSKEKLGNDKQDLLESGLLGRLGVSCDFDQPDVQPHRSAAGEDELITAVTPLKMSRGCWVLILSYSTDKFLGSSLGRPYWDSAEIRLAAVTYLMMAFVVLALFGSIWRNLGRFAALARKLRTRPPEGGLSFVSQNVVPELRGVAAEFDQLVLVLHRTADAIRLAAHENAHALKTPLAIIAQSLEPLRRGLVVRDDRTLSAYGRIEKAVGRLDSLVTAAQQMDQAIAESINPATSRVELSALLGRLVETYADPLLEQGVRLERRIAPGVAVTAGEDVLELVLENVIENARDFSPQGGRILVTLARDDRCAEISIEDQGPGIEPGEIDRIFERYYSTRAGNDGASAGNCGTHFGIGLWIVRRNIEALGGSVSAENLSGHGLRIRLRLPVAA